MNVINFLKKLLVEISLLFLKVQKRYLNKGAIRLLRREKWREMLDRMGLSRIYLLLILKRH
jgi:hypothetical protein